MPAAEVITAPRRVEEVADANVRGVSLSSLLDRQQPVLLKGMVQDWPLVAAGGGGAGAAMDYILSFYAGLPVTGSTGPASIGGRYHYDADVAGLNFEAKAVRLDDYLGELREHLDRSDAPSFYVGSTDLDRYLPGLRAANPPPFVREQFGGADPLISIWLGNRTVATTHWDMSNNLACCAVGHRRFTLFPPDQVANLYPGPLEPTPGGQVVSMVDLRAPDLERYPRFAQALEVAQVAEMEPGDVLFYPALWWHNVEALDAFNAMINIWWNPSPAFLDTPMTTLLHGLLSLRDRPDAEKQAWRTLFDYYVFGPAERAGAHLPDHARGPLAPLDAVGARRLRAMLINKLNR
jgi:hypothetical protein